MRSALWIPVVLALAGLTFGNALGQSTAKQDQALEALMRRLAARKTSTAAFQEVKELSELTVALKSRGILYYKAPDLLRKTVTSPRRETYQVEGNLLTVFKSGVRKGQFQLDEYPRLQAFVESIRATLAGDVDTLKRFYRVSIRGGKGLWLLSLIPRQASLAEVISRIDIQGRGIDLEVIVIEEPGGNKSTMTILSKPRS